MYPFEHAPVWILCKVYIKATDAAFAADATLTSPTKSFAPLIEMNENDVDALTTTLATELYRKHRHAEATSAAYEEILPRSESRRNTVPLLLLSS